MAFLPDFVSRFVTVTVALAMIPPLASLTIPAKPLDWAMTVVEADIIKKRQSKM